MHSLKSFLPTCALIVGIVLFSGSLFADNAVQQTGSRVSIVSSDNSGIELNFELTDLSVTPTEQPGLDMFRVSIEGETPGGNPGFPDLPSINRLIAVPPSAGIELDWSHEGSRTVRIGDVVPVPFENGEGEQVAAMNMQYQTREALYPEQVVVLGKPAIMRGVRIVRVTVNPVQINPVTNELTVWDNVTVRLRYTDDEPVNPVLNPNRPFTSGAIAKMIESLVINPGDVRRDNPQGESAGKGGYLYIIPDFTDEDDGSVEDAMQPLLKWRRQQGYSAEMAMIDENYSNVQVKNLIREYYQSENPPETVCLIGEADRGDIQPMIPTWDVGRAYMWETDYQYVLLEGDDMLPEAAIGRISTRSVRELNRIINTKIFAYEADPHMEDEEGNPDTEWFLSAALMANDARTGYSSVYLQRWAYAMLREVGFTRLDTMYFIHGQNQRDEHDFIRDNINETGITLFNYRGWGEFNGAWGVRDVNQELRNGGKLPLMILPTCNTCDFADHIQNPWSYAEDFLWGLEGGAIGTVGSSGFTHTNYNNVFNGGMLNAFYRDKNWRIGWAMNQGKIEMWRHFGLFGDVEDPQVPNLLVWEAISYQLNLIGDPGTELWTDIPQIIEVDVQETISLGENYLMASLTDAETGDPAAGITVTLLLEDELIRVATSDASGNVRFTFEHGELEFEDVLELTASAHNVKPETAEIGVVEESNFLSVSSFIIDDDMAGQSRGNRDNVLNPGETIELRTFFANYGENAAQGDVTATLECVIGEMELVRSEVEFESPAFGDSALATFIVRVTPETCFDGQRAVFHLSLNNGELNYGSAIELDIGAPDIEYVSHRFIPDDFNIGDTVLVDVTLRNVGAVIGSDASLRLVSGREVVNVFNHEADIGPLDLDDDETTARFRIHAHDLAVPGTKVDMKIFIESTDGLMTGFLDTTSFSFRVDNPESNTPFGPDEYGYVCFDDTDEAWEEIAPVYEWIEIDPEFDDEDRGVDTEIRDQGNEQDWSVLMDLPFTFRYYGEDFDNISICSNGWFSFGDQSKLSDFQNRRIPPALGPRAQVCVFWDDLVNYVDGENQIGGVFTWYDEDNGRFIIEWSRMRRYIGLDGENMREGGLNTFQAIIYDPQVYPTYTGDGDIVFQYHTINNNIDVDPTEFDTPYGTVGIVNLNGTDGIEYTYWNQYPAGAARLADERAIKFSTKLIVVVGGATGSVTDLATGQPIHGAEIRGSRGSFALTDEDGQFMMGNVLIGEDYSFTAWAPGYNEQVSEGFDILEGDTVEMEFALTHPEFNLTEREVTLNIMPDDDSIEVSLELSNDGNGPLTFRSYFDYPEGEDNERWRMLLNVNITDYTDDNYIYGVTDFAGNLWVTGSYNRRDPNFYIFNRQGELVRTVDQPGDDRYGFFDTVVDPLNEIMYGIVGLWLYGVDENGELVDSIPKPAGNRGRALAYDPISEHFWMAEGQSDIIEFDRDGNVIETYNNTLNVKGLAYFDDDPDDFNLYILSQNKTNLALQVPEALVSKFDLVTGNTRVVTVLEGQIEDRAGGMNIVNTYDSHKWVMLSVLTHSDGDRVAVYDLGPNTTWAEYEPRFGELEAGGSVTVEFNFNGIGLEDGDYTLAVHYLHNAAGLETFIPITMNVDSANSVSDNDLLPLEFGLGQNYPNPFNPTTDIPFTLPIADHVTLSVYDIAGREIAKLIDQPMTAGSHSVIFNGNNLPSGIYLVRLKSSTQTAFIKAALIR